MISGLKRSARCLASRVRDRWAIWRGMFGLILIYHRVAPQGAVDFNRLCVTPEHFAAQVAWLKRCFECVSLEELFYLRQTSPRWH